MNQRNEWLSGNLPGQLWEQKKSYIGRLLVRKPSSNHSLSWAWMEPRRPNVELEVPWQLMFMGRSPGEHPANAHKTRWFRLPQKTKKNTYIINRSQNRTISILSFPEFTSVKPFCCLMFQNLVGKPSNPAPPNCPPLILHLANGKIQTSHAKMVTCKVHFQSTKANPSK